MSKDERDIPTSDSAPQSASQAPSASAMNPIGSSVTAAIASSLSTFGELPPEDSRLLGGIEDVVTDPPRSGIAIEFRVVRPGLPVRRLKLTGNRYTFGSGEGCSIRLDDESLRPMHAVLLRDAHRVLMRAYSVPLDCNGERVTETTLRVGDVIRMGSYRFELLSGPVDPVQRGAAGAERSAALQRRLTDLSQQWHARHAECEVRESRCDQRETELHSRESELWKRAESLQRREHLLVAQESAVKEIERTYSSLQNELQDARNREEAASESLEETRTHLTVTEAQLHARQAELEKRQEEWRQREQEYSQRSEETQRKFEQAQDQAQSANDAVARMRSEFATLNEQLTELRDRHRDLQEREQQEQLEHQRLRDELEAARDEALKASLQSSVERETAEAATREVQEELQFVADRLQSTQSELESLREESKSRQKELFEKLRTTSEELQAARAEAEHARHESDRISDQAQKTKAELGDVQNELDEVRNQAKQARAEADFARGEAEKLLSKAERIRGEADTAHQDAQSAHAEAEQARQDAEQAHAEAVKARAEAEKARTEAHQARADVERARSEVEQARLEIGHLEELERKHSQAESLVSDLNAQLAAALASAGDEESAAQETIRRLQDELEQAKSSKDESQSAAEALRSELQSLEVNYAEAQAQASKLQADYEGAQASVRQLELLVDQTRENQSSQTDSWSHESEQLQQTIDQLSTQLAGANAELAKLRESNESLQSELQSDDESDNDLIDRDQFEALQRELDVARSEIEQLKVNHAETLERIETEREENEDALRDEIEELRQEIAAARSWASQAVAEPNQPGPGEMQPPADQAEQTEQDTSFAADASEWSATADPETTEVEHDDASIFQSSSQSVGFAGLADSGLTPVDDVSESAETDSVAASATAIDAAAAADSQSDSAGEPDADWSNVSWADSEYAADVQQDASLAGLTPIEESAASEEAGIQWNEEVPEEAVGEAIREIEHNVEQAIDGFGGHSQENHVEHSIDEATDQGDLVSPDPTASELLRQFVEDDSDLTFNSQRPAATEPDDVAPIDASDQSGDVDPSDAWSQHLLDQQIEEPEPPTEIENFSAKDLSLDEYREEAFADDAEVDAEEPMTPEASSEGLSRETTAGWENATEWQETPPDWSATSTPDAELPEPTDATQQWSAIYDVGQSGSGLVAPVEDASVEQPESDLASEASAQEVDTEPVDEREPESSYDDSPSPSGGGFHDEQTESPADSDDSGFGSYDEGNAFDQERLSDETEDTFSEPMSESQVIGKTTGSLAELLIQDLDRDAAAESESPQADSNYAEPPQAEAPAEEEASTGTSSWYGDEQVSLTEEAVAASEPEEVYSSQNDATNEDGLLESEPTFVMDSPIQDGVESSSGWQLQTPESETADAGLAEEQVGFAAHTDQYAGDAETPTEVETTQAMDLPSATDEAEEPDDDSIEAYMSRLLQRVQGGPAAPTVAPVEAPKPPAAEESQPLPTNELEPISESLSESTVVTEPVQESSVHDSTPLVPRSQAPELKRNLSAMRELANQSARNAVARSIRIQARDTQVKAMMKGGFAASLAIVGVIIYFAITILYMIKLIAIGCLFVLAFAFGKEAYVQARDARRRLALADDGIQTDEQQRAIEEEMRRIAEADEKEEDA
ncbi:MAG: FHA domain-containing protein [Planctomycetota bacterium]